MPLKRRRVGSFSLVAIAGLREDGEFVFGGSTSDIGLILLILELAKDEIIEVAKGG